MIIDDVALHGLSEPPNEKEFDEIMRRQQTVQQSQHADLLTAHGHELNQSLLKTLERQQDTIDELCRIVKMLVVKDGFDPRPEDT